MSATLLVPVLAVVLADVGGGRLASSRGWCGGRPWVPFVGAGKEVLMRRAWGLVVGGAVDEVRRVVVGFGLGRFSLPKDDCTSDSSSSAAVVMMVADVGGREVREVDPLATVTPTPTPPRPPPAAMAAALKMAAALRPSRTWWSRSIVASRRPSIW